MRKLGLGIVGTTLLLSLGGCPLVEVEADIGEVCLTYEDLHVDGAPGQGSVDTHFVFEDLGKLKDLTESGSEVQFLRVKLAARSGISDFDFVDSAKVTVNGGDPQSTLPTLTLVDCAAGTCPTSGPEVTLVSEEESNAVDYIRSGSVLVNVKLAGQMPAHDWSVDVNVCMKATLKVSQGI